MIWWLGGLHNPKTIKSANHNPNLEKKLYAKFVFIIWHGNSKIDLITFVCCFPFNLYYEKLQRNAADLMN